MAAQVQYDYSKLRGRIIEKYGSQLEFSKALGVSNVSVSYKLNCHTGFSREDIENWSNILDIPAVDYGSFYFAKKV